MNKSPTGKSIQNDSANNLYTFAFAEDPNLGARKTMEDFTIIEPRLTSSGEWGLFVVLDGHGGSQIADYTKNNYPRVLRDILQNTKREQSIKSLIELSIQKLSEEMMALKDHEAGTTFCALLINSARKTYYVINIGDSSMVRIQTTDDGKNKLDMQVLTVEHKITNPFEKERIKAVQGLMNNRVGGQLLVTRALGDFAFQPYGITSEPDITEHHMSRERYILIGSDGVWDVIDSEQTRTIIEGSGDKPIQDIVDSFMHDAKLKSIDNISLIGLKF
jgi:protein phosphatase 2C